MICTNCGLETSDQRLACEHCNTVLNKECPRCAEIVKVKAKVCRFCNYEFKDEEGAIAGPIDNSLSQPPADQPDTADGKTAPPVVLPTPATLPTAGPIKPQPSAEKPGQPEVATADQEPIARFTFWYWLGWILVNTLAGAISFWIGGQIAFVVMSSIDQSGFVTSLVPLMVRFLLVGSIAGLVVGVTFGFLQAFLLRKLVRPKHWFWATTLGIVIANALANVFFGPILYNLIDTGLPGGLRGVIVWLGFPFMMGAIIGFSQWLVLRRRPIRIGWWILASALAWSLDLAIQAILLPYHILNNGFEGGLYQINSNLILSGITRGILIGLLTGLALLLSGRIEQRREKVRWVFVGGLLIVIFVFIFEGGFIQLGAAPTPAAPPPTAAMPAAPTPGTSGQIPPLSDAAPTPDTQPNPASSSAPIAILPYNFHAEDAGDGWKIGNVDLAFVNTANQLIPAQVIGFYLLKIQVETLEGKTYPANLFITWDPPGVYGNGQSVNPIVVGRTRQSLGGNSYEINPNGPPLPPRLPIAMVLAKEADTISDNPTIYYTLDGARYRYFVQFRFAAAANPTRLIMPAENFEYRIDLVGAGAQSPELTPLTLTPRPLQDLGNYIQQNNPDVQTSFGECYQDSANYPHDFYQPFTLVNRNQLDEASLNYEYAVWYTNGVYLSSNVQEGGSFLRAGPAQTVNGKLKLLNWGTPRLLVIYTGNGADIYGLNCGK